MLRENLKDDENVLAKKQEQMNTHKAALETVETQTLNMSNRLSGAKVDVTSMAI